MTAGLLGITMYGWATERLVMSAFTMLAFLITMFWSMVAVGAKAGGSIPVYVGLIGTTLRYRIFEDSPYFDGMLGTPGAILVEPDRD